MKVVSQWMILTGLALTLGTHARSASTDTTSAKSTAFGVLETLKDDDVTCHIYSARRGEAIGGISCSGNLKSHSDLRDKSFQTIYGIVERITAEGRTCYVYTGKAYQSVGGVSCLTE